ncbi:septin and tuftelin-interacting protein 1 homolog 1-like isoform X1 [Amaranthus tricolor]|uniref:septin and tuftelin-interacting protein 1 homolog 1-like isoform X1 n=2 Tax=Amaranthus tricolor TaxID=29722 RepID=UPI0025839A0C|nr:septin and tuftelin-interacting protein 1 homolog 1-like isoform X1 [Amaranthus tricolor]
MDDYQEVERFGMDNDFEGGQFIGDEFFYKKRKEKSVQTRDDVLYGVFASGSSDSDYDDDSFSGKKKRRKGGIVKKHDYSKPVNFVSTGIVAPNQEIDRNAKEGIEKPSDEDPDDGFKPGLGLGAGPNSGAGLGFGLGSRNRAEKSSSSKRLDDGVAEEEDLFLPTAFGKMIKEGAEKRREMAKLSGGRKSKSGGGVGRKIKDGKGGDVGSFEKHTKGIGMKLMESMGYKGGGLGKNAQGIVAPIEAKLRPKNMGMGFNDYQESKNLPSLVDVPPPPELEEKQQLSKQREEKLWKKQARARAKKKENIITPDELLALKAEAQGPDLVLQKVVDMRGPQVRVLTNLENLNAEEMARENDIPMPELQHNIRLIIDLVELDIQKIDRDLRTERETAVALQKEKETLQIEVARQTKQIDSMEEVVQVLESIEEEHMSGRLTLESLAKSFWDLQNKFPEEYKLGNLSCMACSFALPLLIRVFQGWDPLMNPSHGMDVMSRWKGLLQGDEDNDLFEDASAPYSQLVAEVVFPAVRIAGINTWQARDPEPMLRFLELWEKLLPPSVLQSLLDMIVMPKLSEAVNSWEPCRETIPIHVWVHPWLPLLGQKLETLYQGIRLKLGTVLYKWHPSDKSAFTILSPWKTVFDAASWEQLIVRSILPKLIDVMQEFQVNPANQILEPFHWVMTWASSVPIHHMVNLLEIHFFSKWQQVLYHWLSTSPNFEEVMQWYLGWKELIPPELLANERVRNQLNLGLDMMNRAAEGLEVVQPGVKENISYLRIQEQRQYEAQLKAAQQTNSVPKNVKEVVEAYAQQHGLHFKPKPGRFHKHHQVYSFGSVNIIVDSFNEQIFAQVQEEWPLVTLDKLVEMQNISGSRRR